MSLLHDSHVVVTSSPYSLLSPWQLFNPFTLYDPSNRIDLVRQRLTQILLTKRLISFSCALEAVATPDLIYLVWFFASYLFYCRVFDWKARELAVRYAMPYTWKSRVKLSFQLHPITLIWLVFLQGPFILSQTEQHWSNKWDVFDYRVQASQITSEHHLFLQDCPTETCSLRWHLWLYGVQGWLWSIQILFLQGKLGCPIRANHAMAMLSTCGKNGATQMFKKSVLAASPFLLKWRFLFIHHAGMGMLSSSSRASFTVGIHFLCRSTSVR